jgi:hypothetical protein
MSRLLAFLFAVSLILAACTGPATEERATLRIGITPNLSGLQPEVHRCASTLPIHLFLVEQPINNLQVEDFDAVIHVGDPPKGASFSTQVGSMKLVIIFNINNPISILEPAVVKSILTGSITDWRDVSPGDFSESTPIRVWSYPEGDDVRQLIEHILLNGHSITPSGRLVPDEQAMIDAVMSNPSAIGFITDITTPNGVQILAVEHSDGFTLPQPILASLSAKAQEAIKPLLVCLSQRGD